MLSMFKEGESPPVHTFYPEGWQSPVKTNNLLIFQLHDLLRAHKRDFAF